MTSAWYIVHVLKAASSFMFSIHCLNCVKRENRQKIDAKEQIALLNPKITSN